MSDKTSEPPVPEGLEELEEYIADMFRMVWRDASAGLGAEKEVVCRSATTMTMKRIHANLPKPQPVSGDMEGLRKILQAIGAPLEGQDSADLRLFDCETLAEFIQAHLTQFKEQGAIEFRDKLSTGGRPLDAKPEIIKQPVPCPRCGAEEYADWSLYPHQVYNSYMPGGIGHYCFPCFAAIVSGLDQFKERAKLEGAQEENELWTKAWTSVDSQSGYAVRNKYMELREAAEAIREVQL